ncbi:MAG: SLC13 family permease [Bacteroidota bacterium]
MEQVVVISVIAGLIAVLYMDWMRPVIAFFLAALVMLVSGVIDSKDLMHGFSNEQIVVVILLLLLSDIIQRTGALDIVFRNIFNPSISYRSFLARLSTIVTGISGFVNNTPLVAILMPYVYNWAKKKNISPSKVLIPLSYATILGGTITLVGTSTNLVVNGFVTDAGYPSLELFDFTAAGIVVAAFGAIYLIFIAPLFLPDRKDALSSFKEKSREYMVETFLKKGSLMIGKTVEEAGLRKLQGLFLVEIVRGNERIAPVSPRQTLYEEDVLIFAGDTNTITDLIRSDTGLELPKYSKLPGEENMQVVEVVVSANSDLIGKIVKETNFRGKFDAAIVAINRDGERITGKLGEVELQSGDLILLLTGKDFSVRAKNEQDFYIISKVQEVHNIPAWKSIAVIAGTIFSFVAAATEWITLFQALLILMSVIVVIQVVKFNEIKNSFDVDLYLILVLALSLGKAIVNTGLDRDIAERMITLVEPLNSPVAVLACIYLLTNVLAMLVTNKAAVAIMFPVTIAASVSLELSYIPFVLAIAFAGSAEFMTPYGYQTNLMVYGPGGYKFKDYIRVGWGLSLLNMIVVVLMLAWIYNLW